MACKKYSRQLFSGTFKTGQVRVELTHWGFRTNLQLTLLYVSRLWVVLKSDRQQSDPVRVTFFSRKYVYKTLKINRYMGRYILFILHTKQIKHPTFLKFGLFYTWKAIYSRLSSDNRQLFFYLTQGCTLPGLNFCL